MSIPEDHISLMGFYSCYSLGTFLPFPFAELTAVRLAVWTFQQDTRGLQHCRGAGGAWKVMGAGAGIGVLAPQQPMKAGTTLLVPPSPGSKLHSQPRAVMPRAVVPPDIFGVGSSLSTNSTHFSRMEDDYFCLWFFCCKHCGLMLFSFPTKLCKTYHKKIYYLIFTKFCFFYVYGSVDPCSAWFSFC